ncbi:transmembrane protein 160 [Scleropages formosus]|uniref:Transmembrane protein 160 n=1 Tax=Scleropages formosus TaxID=113540 RepID=A0A8C9WGR1_SCLFO|nr:transmembrane protein 160 [Scleropages formosus]
MAAAGWFSCRRFPRFASTLGQLMARPRAAPLGNAARWLTGTARTRAPDKGSWGRSRSAEQSHLTELDKADALMLRKSHETGFLSWFRNGLLATGIGVIAFVQSDVGREAGYAFFILGGVCVSFGAASYLMNLFTLRRIMLLSMPAALVHSLVVGSMGLFWLCAVSLYIGRLEVEIIREDEEEEEEERRESTDCEECAARRAGRQPGGRGQDK